MKSCLNILYFCLTLAIVIIIIWTVIAQNRIEHVTTFTVIIDISVQITKLAHVSKRIRHFFLIVKNNNCHLLLFDFSDLVISAYLVNDSKAFSYTQSLDQLNLPKVKIKGQVSIKRRKQICNRYYKWKRYVYYVQMNSLRNANGIIFCLSQLHP